MDLVGHGWSDRPEIDYEIPAYTDHVLKVMAALGRDKAHISGESLGGWVAAHMAIHHPEKVDRIVLNTAGGWTAHPPVMERIRPCPRRPPKIRPGRRSAAVSSS